MIKCDTCQQHGLSFQSTTIEPHEYIEGNPKSLIWIIGLNPKAPVGTIEERSLEQFQQFSPEYHPYFKDFKRVSEALYANWTSENSVVAHTDLVKCFSPSFPPLGLSHKSKTEVIQNCSSHLLKQIATFRPKIIVCNGTDTSRQMLALFPPSTQTDWETITSYTTSHEGHDFWIVLSGFIGRIDNRNRRRLGMEIESICRTEGILL